MQNLYGIWIDHAKAFIVKANQEDVVSVQELNSEVEPHHHSGESGEHLTMSDQREHNERRRNQMHHFCKEIFEELKNPDEIAIFGPGTAKHELKNKLEEIPALKAKLTTFETTDKMTENQLKAYVIKLFKLPLIP